jgi:uncharacterized protein (TIGR02444 family)
MDALWNFSVAVYRQPGVAEECLHLQDEYGVDVNVLLFCAFAGAAHGTVLPAADFAAAKKLVETWHNDVVRPLRNARRALKPFEAGEAAVKTLRGQVKIVELEAERAEQAMLAAWASSHFARWPRQAPRDAVTENIRGLLSGHAGATPQMAQRIIEAALTPAR